MRRKSPSDDAAPFRLQRERERGELYYDLVLATVNPLARKVGSLLKEQKKKEILSDFFESVGPPMQTDQLFTMSRGRKNYIAG